ncbi:MAG: RNA polymerase sigma factor [Planctomycetes bacterium]|nr:RNA polymerase sigma factor [Planctomycetota bacterium]
MNGARVKQSKSQQGRKPDQPQMDSDPSRMTPMRELQLLQEYRLGKAEAIDELLESYQRRVYSVCYRMLRHEHDALDLAQESMVKILEGLDSYDGRSKLSTWIIRVTMNCCLSHLRKQKVRRASSLDGLWDEDGSPHIANLPVRGELSGSDRVEQAERAAIITRSLLSLDPQMRAVLVLRDVQDLDYQQIGTVMGVPVGTVKSRLFRARAALRAAAELEFDRSADKDGH